MINVLAIGLDYLMLQKMKFRGDVIERQFEYAKQVESFHHLIYSPKNLGFSDFQLEENRSIYPTNSSLKIFFYFDAIKRAKEILKANKIDIITTEDPFITGLVGYKLKKKYRLPLNVQVHVDFCNNPYWIKDEAENRFFNLLGKWVLKRADTIRIGTSYEKDKLIKLGIKGDRIGVIPVHSNFGKFAEANGENLRKQLLSDKFDYLLFTAARITNQKDLGTMIKAFRILRNSFPRALLIIAGDGPERKTAENLVRKLSLEDNIRFIGAVDHNILPDYYSACDIFLLSSIFEGTCITIAEAASAGKVVVVSRIAGSYDLVKHGENGLVFDIGDYETMARHIYSLLSDKDMAVEMGKIGQELVRKHFSYDQNIKGLITLWEKTADK